MTYSSVKRISGVFAALALIVGLLLIWHGSSDLAVINLTNLSLLQARTSDAVRLFQILLGVGALVVAIVSYHFSTSRFEEQ